MNSIGGYVRNENCTKCPLHESAKTVCLWGVGPKRSPLMLVGEAPGQDEDIHGEPFVGRAGAFLDYALKRIGVPRECVYITNAVKCHPENNKLPTRKADREKIQVCADTYLKEEIELVKPRVILCMGTVALEALTGHANISMWHGRTAKGNIKFNVKVIAAYHPAFILRNRWKERDFVSALALAAGQAGLPINFLKTGELFDYDEF